MESLLGLWEKFLLSESEGSRFVVEESDGESEYFLAARFYTGRMLSMVAIAKTLKGIWRTRRGFEVRDMGDHRVLFIFRDEGDVEHIMKGEPWTFDKHLVALKRIKKHSDLSQLKFETTCMWVQVHNLPIGISSSAAKSIVSATGKVFENSLDKEVYEGNNFVRVRVGIDITKPLCRGRKLALRDGQDSLVCFKYERIPNICHWCSKLTHMDKECSIWLKGKHTLKEVEQQFRSWMRVATPNLARKSVVKVVGFDENESETKESGQDNEVVRQDSGDNHEPMVLSHDIVNSILVKQVEMRDDIEVKWIGPRGSLNMKEVEVECDDTP